MDDTLTYYRFDIFIAHASEDKDELVRPLATALVAAGVRVWYDEFTLSLGDNLREAIDRGLALSRYGLIILSKAFFGKRWPSWELDGLLQRQLEGAKVILPIWHGITAADVKKFSFSLANVKAVSTDTGLASVMEQILDVVESERTEFRSSRPPQVPSAMALDQQGTSETNQKTRSSTSSERIEPEYAAFASALEASSDTAVQILIKEHPGMLFYVCSIPEVARGNFWLLDQVMLDAIVIGQPQMVEVTLVILAPVSEVPFSPSGGWSPGLATAVGRIAQAQHWIRDNPRDFYISIASAFRYVRNTGFLQTMMDEGPEVIRTDFLILIGRRASMEEKGRFRFHESLGNVRLLSYDSILRGRLSWHSGNIPPELQPWATQD